jgi:ATP-dependent DNA helicase PIF1
MPYIQPTNVNVCIYLFFNPWRGDRCYFLMLIILTFLLLLFLLQHYSQRRDALKRHAAPALGHQPMRTKPSVPFTPQTPLPDNLVITAEFQRILDVMEHTGKCAYITGKAGTGKSTLLTYFRQTTRKRCVVLTPTGVAALTVEGATINSFFGFPPRLLESKNIPLDKHKQPLYQALELIIIDEVSMVRPDVLDAIDYSLRLHRQSIRPFGGVQLIFFGDLYQLPPVVSQDLAGYFDAHFGGVYFFNARVFRELDLTCLELQTIFRQKNEQFKEALNRLREGVVHDGDLALINSRYQPQFVPAPDDRRLTLTTTHHQAERISRERLLALSGPEHIYRAVVKGRVDQASFPTDPRLSLKPGAQVMLLKNDPQMRWVNGSMGIIRKLSAFELSLEIKGSVYKLSPATWEVMEYRYHTAEKKILTIAVGSFSQFPVKPAWAITIHKSQGLTFDQLIIDLGTGAFEHGQVYVALSRCRSLDGIVLTKPLQRRDIIVDERVKEFIQAKMGNSASPT